MKFGTDGIRGIAYSQLTLDLAKAVGNILGSFAKKVLVGRDTRVSGKDLSEALSQGFSINGGQMLDCGIMPTAGVAYLTKKYECDFGVVISASHNPPEYNGIKIFDKNGYKISEELEHKIEIMLENHKLVYADEQGEIIDCKSGQDDYADFLVAKGVDLEGMKILLDCSNGASSNIAPIVFKRLGANVDVVNNSLDGSIINKDCGAVCAELLCEKAKNYDVTFSFDGDSDRLIALDENGKIVDGDMILYIIGKYLKNKGLLKNNLITGTLNTNMGIEKCLVDMGIKFDRVDVGDKYILRNLLAKDGILGGEGSGHTIMLNESSTGDGIQTAVVVAKIIKESKKLLSVLMNATLTPQINVAFPVQDKVRIVNDKTLLEEVEKCQKQLGFGRILLRASGTENKVRLTVEGMDKNQLNDIVNYLTKIILHLES